MIEFFIIFFLFINRYRMKKIIKTNRKIIISVILTFVLTLGVNNFSSTVKMVKDRTILPTVNAQKIKDKCKIDSTQNVAISERTTKEYVNGKFGQLEIQIDNLKISQDEKLDLIITLLPKN